MSAIRKTILSGGKEHYVQIDSSLDLEEVEITGTDPVSGKTIHVSLSSLLKQPTKPIITEIAPAPMSMFSGDEIISESAPVVKTEKYGHEEEKGNSDNVINDLFD